MNDKRIAFWAGDLLVTVCHIFSPEMLHHMGDFGIKILTTLILGVAGGVAGMIGKDIHARFKNWRAKKQTP